MLQTLPTNTAKEPFTTLSTDDNFQPPDLKAPKIDKILKTDADEDFERSLSPINGT